MKRYQTRSKKPLTSEVKSAMKLNSMNRYPHGDIIDAVDIRYSSA